MKIDVDRFISSALAYKKFYPLVVDASENGALSITFVDNDR